MQALIVLPGIEAHQNRRKWEQKIFRPISGIPLLQRIVATACNAGITSVMIAHPDKLSPDSLRDRLLAGGVVQPESVKLVPAGVRLSIEDLGPIQHLLEPGFLWLPWNFVTVKAKLSALLAQTGAEEGAVLTGGACGVCTGIESYPDTVATPPPAWILTRQLFSIGKGSLTAYLDAASIQRVATGGLAGVRLVSRAAVRRAEDFLMGASGKPSDGIYSRLNRTLCRPILRYLLRMPISANAITLTGIPVVLLAGYLYSLGHWAGYALGGLTYFTAVLLDEIDGMVARTKFQESPFGCWLETIVDYLGYLVLWSGIALGLTRQFGGPWLWVGVSTMVANLITFGILIRQRKRTVPADHPEAFHTHFTGQLEGNSASQVSRGIRKISFLAKKGVMCHYVLLFSLAGLIRVLFGLVVLGSGLTLLIVAYVSGRFPTTSPSPGAPLLEPQPEEAFPRGR